MRARLPRPTYANVMSTLAVVLSLTMGTAYAAGLGRNAVHSKNIADNAVKMRHIANGAVQGSDLTTGSVDSRAIADESVAVTDLAPDSVGKSELKVDTVDSARIQNGQVRADDIASGSVNNTKLSSGVRNLMYDGGALALNKTFGDVSVSSSSWPGGAPATGAQFSAAWTQPPNTLDIVSGTARVAYPEGCSATNSTPRGFDVKIIDGSNRVISASSSQRTDGVNYNGNGYWAEQVALPGVGFRAPSGSDLVSDPDAFVDYIHLPFELAETVTGGSSANRTVRVFLKRNSASCTPVITGTRIFVYRFATG